MNGINRKSKVHRTRMAENLRMLRLEKGMQQQEVAAQAGVSRPALSSWETGRAFPGWPNVFKMATFYKVEPADLIAPAKNQVIAGCESESQEVKQLEDRQGDWFAPAPKVEANVPTMIKFGGDEYMAVPIDRYKQLIDTDETAYLHKAYLEEIYDLTCNIETALTIVQDAIKELL